ncbi:hypothetical protein WA538_001949 [Blastocystis sp. DL]
MNDETKVEVDLKKPEVTNNEQMVDVKPGVTTVVIPSKPVEQKTEEAPKEKPAATITNTEFAITIVKSVTGMGCLGIPCAMAQMGIIPMTIMYLLVTAANIINTYYLVDANDGIKRSKLPLKSDMKIENDYANLMYQLFGMWGYYIFLVFLFLTVYGVMLGSMISMFEFIANLPYPENFLGGFKTRSIIMYLFTTVVTYVLCLIRDTKKLYFVSWFGIFTLVLSYLVVIIYGLCTINIKFDASLLFSRSTMGFLSNLGTAPYTLGYNFCFLTYYKQVERAQQPRTLATTKKSIFAVCLVYLLFSVSATVIYGSVRDADGNLAIPANLVKALPPSSVCGAGIYALMWLSCVCSMPVLLASTAEVLEKNCPQGDRSFFVRDKGRLLSRLVQILLLAVVSYLVPFFGEVVNIFGGFAFVATSILIPVVIHFCVYRTTLTQKQRTAHFALGTAAFVLMVVATYFSTVTLIRNMRG